MGQQTTWIVTLPLAATVLAGCGGGGGAGDTVAAAPATIRATSQSLQLAEDTELTGVLAAESTAASVTFRVSVPPGNGTVRVTEATGAFAYLPAPDFFGEDSFSFSARDAAGNVATAVVDLRIEGVDDPPEIASLPDTGNSSTGYAVVLPLAIRHTDDEPLQITATVQNETVVEARVDQATRQLVLEPRTHGTSGVEVRVNDGRTTASTSFTFTVGDVARHLTVTTSAPESRAVMLRNPGGSAQDFELTHNGRHAFTSLDQILDVIRAQPDEVPGEPFERKLWRYLRDNTYHHAPVSGAGWMDGTWPTLASFGWGFCSNVTSAFIQLAEAAGYEARAWSLGGHVMPEIRIGDRWQVYDPDVAVYYFRRDGEIASVEDLAADSTLISDPTTPLFQPGGYAYAYVYDPLLARIYETTEDNRLAPWYPSDEPFHGSRITLPAGSRLIYPGRWTASPTGYDGARPYPVEAFRQARLEIPAGTTGALEIPWVLWDVQGSGTVRVRGEVHAVGSAELSNGLASASASVTELEIVDNPGGMALVMMINPLWYDMQGTNEVIVTGKDVWMLDAGTVELPVANRVSPVPDEVRRPRPGES